MCADVMVSLGSSESERRGKTSEERVGKRPKTTIDMLFGIMVNAGYGDAVKRLERFRENPALVSLSLEVMGWDRLDEEDQASEALGLVANVFGNTDEGILKCIQDADRRLKSERTGY